MTVPYRVDDGNFNVALINGPPRIVYPFADQGDSVTWEYWATYRIDAEHYFRYGLAPIGTKVNTPLGVGYIFDPGEPSDASNGLYDYTVGVGAIPQTRIVGGSIPYNHQLFDGETSNPAVIREFQNTVGCSILWQYGLSPFAVRHAPRLVVGFGGVPYAIGDWVAYTITPGFVPGSFSFATYPISYQTVIAAGTLLLAEDTDCNIYKGPFYYIKAILITFPNLLTVS